MDRTIVEVNTLVSFFEGLRDIKMTGIACLIEICIVIHSPRAQDDT